MVERRTHPDIALQAPATTKALPEDWKLEAACSEYVGPIMDLPASLCAVCPVREQCEATWVKLQGEIDEDRTQHATRVYLGGVWSGEPKREARHNVRHGPVPIVPCTDECDAPRHARGACKNHYNAQHAAFKRGRPNVSVEPRICDIDGCTTKHESRGFCAHHYHQWRKAEKLAGREIVRPAPKVSTKPIDEPTNAGWARALRAGRQPTAEQAAAHALYAKNLYHERKAAA